MAEPAVAISPLRPFPARLPVTLVLALASARAFSSSLRGNVLRLLGSTVGVWSEALGVVFLLTRFDGIAGWTTAEVLVLVGIGSAGLGLGMLVGEPLEPPAFSQLLREGRFDQALTRPMSSLVWVVVNDVQIRNAGRVIAGLVITIAAAAAADVPLTPASVGLVVGATLAMAVLVAALLTIGAAITMWTIEGTELLNSFTYGGAALVGWPLQIYASALRAVFLWIVPVGAAVYVPTLWLLDHDGGGVVSRDLLPAVPLLVLGFCGVAALAWKAGLRHHTGAGG